MTETLTCGQPADCRELAKRVRSHPFVDGPTRKLVRSWIEREPAHQIPWTPLAKPLSACRVALVSSAGIARHDQRPFDQDLERCDPWWSDQSWRPIPSGTTEADAGIYHLHIYHLHIDPRFEHSHNIAEVRGKLFAEFAEDHFMTFYGEVSPELFDMVEAMQKAGHVRVTWFDFLQGLESPVST
jgi:hypothetical protein